MKRNRLTARVWFDIPVKRGTPSRVIQSFDTLRPGDRVYLACRKSNCDRRSNLDDQERKLRVTFEDAGAVVAGSHKEVCSGWDLDWLLIVAAEARRLRADIIAAECTNRFVRHRRYHSKKRPELQATDTQLRELASITTGIRLMTHLHPDAIPSEERSYQTKRGHATKGNKGGRRKIRHDPSYKDKASRLAMSKAFWLTGVGLKSGHFSVRSIAKIVKRSPSTIQGWIDRILGK